MLWHRHSFVYLVALVWILAMVTASASHAADFEGLSGGEYVPSDRATWAAYYRKHAHVRLEPEHRLPNGVSWRLHEDVVSKLAMPRVTWMPDSRSMRSANDMLDMVHGGSMLFSWAMGQELDQINDFGRSRGLLPLEYGRPVVQTDVGLTYATSRLISLVDLGYVEHQGSGVPRIMRGVTLDLLTRQMYRIEACSGSEQNPPNGRSTTYLFQFGKLLRVCDRPAYIEFIQLLKRRANLIAEQVAKSRDPVVRECSEMAGPFIGEDQEIVLYLTFTGLAVHNTEYRPNAIRSTCTLARSPVNPVILPYRELEPFMIPGAWRDELLRLH